MSLDGIRKEIDGIDRELTGLIEKRMDLSRKVAEYKAANGIPVLDKAREEQVLDRVAGMSEKYPDAVRMIYSAVLEQSKAMQYPLVKSEEIFKFKPLKKHCDVRVIACQGIGGSYSSLAGKVLYPNADILYCDTFADVCRAVNEGRAEYGILPVENSWAGSVHEVYDLLIGGKLMISECIDARIKHCLIGMPDAVINDIKCVVSHPQALKQCSDTLIGLGCKTEECTNTAQAVKTVADRGDITLAAIGSAEAAKEYGLKILLSGAESSGINTTRFVSVSDIAERSPDADKISIVFSLTGADKPGALANVLSHFASCSMSLTKLESRPIKGSRFEYVFYADFVGNLDDSRAAGVLATLKKELPGLVLLGNYRESMTELI